MANLRDIRDRISSVKSTQQITKAMKMVAAAKLRKAQNRMIQNRPYAGKLKSVMNQLSSKLEQPNPFISLRKSVNSVLFIVVSSDRGLCGGFNNNLFKVVDAHINNELAEFKENGLSMLCIGRKSHEYYSKRGYKVLGNYSGFYDDLRYEKAASIMGEVRNDFEIGNYDAVYLAYNEFKSVLSQNRIVETILPISPKDETTKKGGDILFEPNVDAIVDSIIPQYLNTALWKALLESNASEQGARMVAMDNATENAHEILRNLRLKYNQARQAAITTEISEIVSGAAALSD